MSLRFRVIVAFLAIPLWFGALGADCDCQSGPGDPPGDGLVRVYLEAKSGMPDLGSISFVLERVDIVHRSSAFDPETVLTVASGPLVVATPGIGFDVPSLFLEFFAPPGFIDQIRIIGRDGELSFRTGTVPFRVPPGETTGLRIIPAPETEFAVTSERTLRILSILDPLEDLSFNQGTGWRLQPVVRGTPTDILTISDHLDPTEQVLHAKLEVLRDSGRALTKAKVFNAATGGVRLLVLDEQGDPVDLPSFLAAEKAAYLAARGRLARGLAERLDTLDDEDIVPVSIWYDVASLPRLRDLDRASPSFEADRTALLSARDAALDAARAGLTAALDAAPDATLLEASERAPRLLASASKRFILDELRDRTDVELVFDAKIGSPLGHLESLDLGMPDFHDIGISGSGVTVAVLELGQGVHNTALTDEGILTVSAQRDVNTCSTNTDCVVEAGTTSLPGQTCVVGECGSLHTNGVASLIGSIHPANPPALPTDEPVSAFGATLVIANADSGAGGWLGGALDYALDPAQDAVIAVLSTEFEPGEIDGEDVLLESAVLDSGLLLVRGAGNSRDDELDVNDWPMMCDPPPPGAMPCEVTDCDGFAPVCVGGYDPRGTFGPGNFFDDLDLDIGAIDPTEPLRFGSGTVGSYLNPPGTDRELPDVVAPYLVNIAVCEELPSGVSDCTFGSAFGTSFGTPLIGGFAANLMELEPSLVGQPELTKAILIASGIGHDITAPPISDYLPPDQRDGAGAPLASAALDVLGGAGAVILGTLDRENPADFSPTGTGNEIVALFESDQILFMDQVVRGVLVWSACPDPTPGASSIVLPDLDLRLYRVETSEEVLIKHSSSMDHGVEIIQFLVDEPAGFYRFRIFSNTALWPDCPARMVPDRIDFGFARVAEL